MPKIYLIYFSFGSVFLVHFVQLASDSFVTFYNIFLQVPNILPLAVAVVVSSQVRPWGWVLFILTFACGAPRHSLYPVIQYVSLYSELSQTATKLIVPAMQVLLMPYSCFKNKLDVTLNWT